MRIQLESVRKDISRLERDINRIDRKLDVLSQNFIEHLKGHS